MSLILALRTIMIALVLSWSGLVQGQNCPGVSFRESVQPVCSPLSNCTGVWCYSDAPLLWNTSFVVDKCTDPVVIRVRITPDAGSSVDFTFTESGTKNKSGFILNLFTNRDASSIVVDVETIYQEDILARLIPPTTIPLNASACMCESMHSLAANAPSPATCASNTACDGVECQVPISFIPNGNIEVDGVIDPCSHPPGFTVVISYFIGEIFRRKFTASTNLTLPTPIGGSLRVIVVELPYSIVVEADLVPPSNNTVVVIPRQQIILDKTRCPVATEPTAPPSNSPITAETCATLENIAHTIQFLQCSVNDQCSGMVCNAFSHRSVIQLLPCHNPPGFSVRVYDPSESLLYNQTVTKDTTFTVDNVVLEVRVKQTKRGFTVKVDVTEPVIIPVLPTTEIPLDRCQCPNIDCPSPSISTSSSSSSSLPALISSITLPTRTTPTSRGAPLTTVLAVSVPLVGIILGAVVLLIVVVVVLFIKQRSRTQFAFQTMTSLQSDDEEEQEEK